MIKPWFNWRSLLALIALLIVAGSIFYARYLSAKLAEDEKQKVEAWVEAQKTILLATDQTSLNLAIKITSENTDIPIIETNEKDSATNNYLNLDTVALQKNPAYLQQQLKQFKALHQPIIMVLKAHPYQANKYYYGESRLQREMRFYPLVQLLIVALFIIITLLALSSSFKSTQNRLWTGMAKETAHQLGTPVSSLHGWLELLKTIEGNETLVPEIAKDINRLQLITDRFGKIGSTPHLEAANIYLQVAEVVEYVRKRAGGKIQFDMKAASMELKAAISPPLFDWVIENLLKNALDAMDDKGFIQIELSHSTHLLHIDITDSGKGIAREHFAKVFRPGFTTKKRGWGLGLALAKRIITEYHNGGIYVKHSELGKGTTFRIDLPLLTNE